MKNFVGNRTTVKYLEKAVACGQLSHAYLFCGPQNVGKTRAAEYFARLLLCTGENPLKCKDCPSCKLFETGNHPDFFHLSGEGLVIDGVRELVNSLELKPYYGRGKVAVVSHADNLTVQAQNALLKTLEEPSPKTTIILTTENSHNLLETIASRARSVNFGLVPEKQIYELVNGELGVVKNEAAIICGLAAGRPGIAVNLSENGAAATGMTTLARDFARIYKSSDIYEKISFAEKLVKDKDTLLSKLDSLEVAARSELIREKITTTNRVKVGSLVKMIDNIIKSRDRLATNANAKLVIEGLLLGNVT